MHFDYLCDIAKKKSHWQEKREHENMTRASPSAAAALLPLLVRSCDVLATMA
jgi:hypothetical protein